MPYTHFLLEHVLEQLPTLDEGGAVPDTDVLILANGFEPRCTTVAANLRNEGRRIPLTITLHFPTNTDENDVIWDGLSTLLDELSPSRTSILMNTSPLDFSREIISALPQGSSSEPVRVLLDISGASGRMILLTLRSLFTAVRQRTHYLDVVIAYTEAEEYAPSQDETDATIAELKQAVESRAVLNPELTLGLDRDPQESCVAYEGHHVEDGPDRAIVICGFNAHRVRAALDDVDPSFNTNLPHPLVTYIVGEPPRAELAWRLDAMKELNAFGTDANDMRFRTSSTLHYQETLQLLEKLYELSFGAERITVLPFGSKMQNVAVALFCEIHADVRAQVITPTTYRGSDYSKGSGSTYVLNFGSLDALVDQFDRVGSIVRS